MEGILQTVLRMLNKIQTNPIMINSKEISLYGKPAKGKTATEKDIPIAAKKEITQGVHP
jgi:hypothetical protein